MANGAKAGIPSKKQITEYLEAIQILRQLNDAQVLDHLATGNWSHSTTDGKTFEQRAELLQAGEILYRGGNDLEEAIKAWLNSPTHKAVIKNNYKYFSLVCVPSANGCFVVGNFLND